MRVNPSERPVFAFSQGRRGPRVVALQPPSSPPTSAAATAAAHARTSAVGAATARADRTGRLRQVESDSRPVCESVARQHWWCWRCWWRERPAHHHVARCPRAGLLGHSPWRYGFQFSLLIFTTIVATSRVISHLCCTVSNTRPCLGRCFYRIP